MRRVYGMCICFARNTSYVMSFATKCNPTYKGAVFQVKNTWFLNMHCYQ